MRVLVLVLLLLPVMAHAQNLFDTKGRSGKLETTFGLIHQNGAFLSSGQDAYLDINDDQGFMFSLGYNYNSHLTLMMDVEAVRSSYRGQAVSDDTNDLINYRGKTTTSRFMFGANYNFFDGAVTPYVGARGGWRYIDTNIPDGTYYTGCYWDYYWGYICNTYANTYSESDFGYTLSAGLRWDFDSRWFVRVGGAKDYFNSNADGDEANFTVYRFEFGMIL